MTDFETWLHDVGRDRIFRMFEFRRIGDWTPEEIEKKWSDQSQYVEDESIFVKIREAIELPDGEILLGLQYIYDWSDLDMEDCVINYRKLSQIELSYFPNDMKEENWD